MFGLGKGARRPLPQGPAGVGNRGQGRKPGSRNRMTRQEKLRLQQQEAEAERRRQLEQAKLQIELVKLQREAARLSAPDASASPLAQVTTLLRELHEAGLIDDPKRSARKAAVGGDEDEVPAWLPILLNSPAGVELAKTLGPVAAPLVQRFVSAPGRAPKPGAPDAFQPLVLALESLSPEQAAHLLLALQPELAQALGRTPDRQLGVLLDAIAAKDAGHAALVAWLRQRDPWTLATAAMLRRLQGAPVADDSPIATSLPANGAVPMGAHVRQGLDGKSPAEAAAWLRACPLPPVQAAMAQLLAMPEALLPLALGLLKGQPEWADLAAWLEARGDWTREAIAVLKQAHAQPAAKG